MKALVLAATLARCSFPVTADDVARALPAVNDALRSAELVSGERAAPVSVGYLPAPQDGFTDGAGSITVSDSMSVGNAVAPVVLHEYGHALGLGHVDDPSNVMWGGLGGPTDLGVGARQLREACAKRSSPCAALAGTVMR